MPAPLAQLVDSWRARPDLADCFTHVQNIPARQPSFAPFPAGLDPRLTLALQELGIHRLYSHQAQTIQFASQGSHVVLVTGTASGKSLAYNLPVIQRLLDNPAASALYLFPTKALAQDQLNLLQRLLPPGELPPAVPLRAAIYDGDTPSSARRQARQATRLILSNPDMLHMGILPYHTRWAAFFAGLQFVIIDEMHTYRGVFGAHVANVLRRLRRICRHYGANPQFILTSATIANPAELAARLVEPVAVPLEVIAQDDSARGARQVILYNPPVVNPALGLRRSARREALRLLEELTGRGYQTLMFTRTRRSVELALAEAESSASRSGPVIRGYRSGYLPGHRREIEQGLRDGSVRAVISTNALEAGIDIGSLEAALLVGYPGSIASLLQQAGRAGRRLDDALAVFVATPDPIDQYLVSHPDYLFQRTPEQALVDPDNLLILMGHLRCAAFELPFTGQPAFGAADPALIAGLLDALENQGSLHRSRQGYYWMSDQYPAGQISLRNASAERITLQATVVDEQGLEISRTVGMVDRASAVWMVHPGAVYLHEGEQFEVDALDLEGRTAALRPSQADYYTEARTETEIEALDVLKSEPISGGVKFLGDIRVHSQVTAFRRIRWFTNEQLGLYPLDLPPSELVTTAYWFTLSEEAVAALREAGAWNADPNAYGPGWERVKRLARARDGYRCQVCGALENRRSHDVHHKLPFRAFRDAQGHPDPTAANRLENLLTLCPACHRRAEQAVRVRTGLGAAAFLLAQLAPLHLLCDPHDLGAHADMQAGFAGGAPAVVIYDNHQGGIGLSRRLYEIHAELIHGALELTRACACQDGCPSCVGPGGELGYGGKPEALALFELLARQAAGEAPHA